MFRGFFLATAGCALVVAGLHPSRAHATACDAVAPEFAEFLAERWLTAFKSGRRDGFSKLYAPDAVVVSPARRAPRATPAAVARHVADLVKSFRPASDPNRTIRTGCTTVLAYGTMRLTARSDAGPIRFDVQYSRMFEPRDGDWKITVEHMSEVGRAFEGIAALVEPDLGPDRGSELGSELGDDSQRLTALVSAASSGQRRPGLRRPEVAGMLIRPPRLAVPPARAARDEPAPVAKVKKTPVAAKSTRRRSKRSAQRSPSLDWARKLPGFEMLN